MKDSLSVSFRVRYIAGSSRLVYGYGRKVNM